MPVPDPMMQQHFHLLEKLLEYFAIFVTGGGVTLGGNYVVKKRRNGKENGKANLSDVVSAVNTVVGAIHDSGEKTRTAILEDGKQTRRELSETREVIRDKSEKQIQATEKAAEVQLGICNSNVVRAEKIMTIQEELLRREQK